MKKINPIVLIFFLLVPSTIFGIEYRRQYQDYRSLAMGNTGIASANNSATIFYNPAALANITEGWMDFPDFQAIYSKEAESIYEDLQSGSFLDSSSEIATFMTKYMGKNIYAQVDIGTSFFFNADKKGLTIGGNMLAERIYEYKISNPAVPQIDAFERYDIIRQIGFSYPIGLGQFILGGTAKEVDRSEKSFTYTMLQADNGEDFPSSGFPGVSGGEKKKGTGYDVGFLWRFATPFRLVLGGVWRKKIDLGEDVTDLPEESALGITMAHSFGLFRWTFAVDVRDISYKQGSEDDVSLNRRVQAGTEFSMFPSSDMNYLLSVRGGYNQGYPSWGGEVRLGNFLVLGVAHYTEEIGEFAGETGNIRTAAFFSLGF